MDYRYEVFISYSTDDQKVVEGICAYLEQHHIRCFVAYRDIPAGVVWAKAIVDGLDNSRMMLVVFSGSFNSSEQVDREIELASEDHKPILTFRITDDAFRGAKKYYLKNINWIDAFPNPERSFGPLLNNICRLLDINPQKQTGAVETTVSTPATTPSSTRPKAVPANSTHEYYDASLMDSMSDAEQIAYLRKWAELGNADAQYELALSYDDGKGVTQDKVLAVKWYRKAAHAEAQNCLGNMYYYGKGVAQDKVEAVKWYRKAAEQGYAGAQYNLGVMYENGEGVAKDKVKAVKWYRKAAEQGDETAKKRLNELGY